MTLLETRLKLLEISRPNNSDPDPAYWIRKARALEEYVVEAPALKTEAAPETRGAVKTKAAAITSTKAPAPATP